MSSNFDLRFLNSLNMVSVIGIIGIKGVSFQVSLEYLKGYKSWMLEGSEASPLPESWLPSFRASKL
jgi:hypothetical protein